LDGSVAKDLTRRSKFFRVRSVAAVLRPSALFFLVIAHSVSPSSFAAARIRLCNQPYAILQRDRQFEFTIADFNSKTAVNPEFRAMFKKADA
jgi:hypothetical protein